MRCTGCASRPSSRSTASSGVLGFTGFSLRGLDKVAGEWDLVALAYNCKRLHKLKLEMAV